MQTIPIEDTQIYTWFERDRAHVSLDVEDANGNITRVIVEWWDAAVSEAIEDGFLNPRRWHESAYEYAESVGLLAVA